MNVEGKLVVVTGAAQGIGEGLASRFAHEGARQVICMDIDEDGVHKVAKRLENAEAFCVDVADESSFASIMEQVQSTYGPVDLMCANAGIALFGGVELPNEEWQRIFEVNVMSHVYATRAVLPQMIERGEGYILTVASAAGMLTSLGAVSYAVTKHAAVAFAEWISITHGKQGVKVSCLCPMGVDTDMIHATEWSAKMLLPDAITVDELVDATVVGLAKEEFLILPHPQVAKFAEYRVHAHERWLSGMRDIQEKLQGQA